MAGGKEIGYGEGKGLCQGELPCGHEPDGLEHKAEGEVEARGAVPVVAALAYAGGLLQGPIAGEVLHLSEVEDFTIFVGGLHRVQLDDLHGLYISRLRRNP